MDSVTSDKGAYFPQSYLTDLFKFVSRNSDKIQIITYEDLDWNDDFDYVHGYLDEKQRWLKGLKKGEIDPNKAYLLIQYDLDSRPERAMSLLSDPSHLNVPANIMLFNKRVDRRLLKSTNQLEYTDYKLDDSLLQLLSGKGFVLGYHSNCYERSHHNIDQAPAILHSDIEELKSRFNIDFYTAHGGVPCVDGRNNRDVNPLVETSSKVRWVHNGATPFFNKQFSDGGHNSPLRDPAERDIRDFVSRMLPGGRYRILVHPQYYDIQFGLSKRYAGTAWYDDLLSNISNDTCFDSWGSVVLENFISSSSVKGAKMEREALVFRDQQILFLKNLYLNIRRMVFRK